MASNKSEYLLKTFKCLAQVPALVKAKFANEKIVHSVWSERNLEKGKAIKFQRTFVCTDGNNKKFTALAPIDITSQLLSAESPCQKFQAIIRSVEGKDQTAQYLEVWNENALIRSIDLTALDLHDKVYTDDEFGSFKWSPLGSKILYVAEKKMPKTEPLHKRLKPKKDVGNQNDDEKDILKVEKYRQDWGEQLVGKVSSIIVIYDMETDEFTIPEGIPENVCIAKPFWSNDGKSILGICYYTEPRKLGLIYCVNRHSSLFTLTLEGTYEELSKLKCKTVNKPMMTPDGQHLIWFQCEAGGPHINCMQLYKAELPLSANSEIKLLVDYVDSYIEINDKKPFYGFYDVMIPARCWTDDQRLLLSDVQKNAIVSYVVDIKLGTLTELACDEGNQIILDVWEDNVLIKRGNFLQQDVLLQGKLPPTGLENSIGWTPISTPYQVESLKEKMFKYMELSHQNGDEIDNFSAIYIGPKNGNKAGTPLIIWPHGGPHSASVNSWALDRSYLLSHGYAVVLVNYRGSIGAGKKSLEYLPGKAGSADVADCVLATTTALSQFPWLDPKRICLLGGSHGGFLVTHLSGQYPDMYRAVVTVNPVTDIATMSGGSDIPDWCYVEAGYDFSQEGAIKDDILLAMRQKSPIVHAHKVKAPTLLQIGTKDLRVPPFQGIDYYHRLKANNICVSMNIYEDNHPLGEVPNEINEVLTTIKWLEEHCT